MTRILIAECKQEISSFNPVLSGYEDFAVLFGQAILDHHRPLRDEVGGALSVFDQLEGVSLTASYSARAITSGGTLSGDAFARITREFTEALRGQDVDGCYFAMHGAMAAETEDDPEGLLLEIARQILGEEIPIVVSLDLHGICTDKMLSLADAVVVYHTYPHVDFFETGVRAANVLMRILRDNVRPTTARVAIPALVRGDELITESGSFGECIRMAQRIEAEDAGVSAGMFIGNPFTDVPELRTNSLVVLDGQPDEAHELALDMARVFWSHHEKMRVPLTSLDKSIEEAKHVEGTCALMDAADATSSGASGNSNAILAALLAAGYEGTALIPLVDPTAAAAAIAAGVGETVKLMVGGSLDPRYPPLPLEGVVRMVSDGHFLSESFAAPWFAGPTAVVRSGNTTLIISSRAVSLYDRAFFYAHGQDPKRFDLVVVKSPHCEPHMFADWCGRVINVDAPGATSADVRSLGHTKCARPMFPLDGDVEFQPDVRIFSRSR